jgi:hypothetical protein
MENHEIAISMPLKPRKSAQTPSPSTVISETVACVRSEVSISSSTRICLPILLDTTSIDIIWVSFMSAFYPFRSVGIYTDEYPFALQRLGTTTFVTVPVGKSFQIFNVLYYSGKNLSFGFPLDDLRQREISRGFL